MPPAGCTLATFVSSLLSLSMFLFEKDGGGWMGWLYVRCFSIFNERMSRVLINTITVCVAIRPEMRSRRGSECFTTPRLNTVLICAVLVGAVGFNCF